MFIGIVSLLASAQVVLAQNHDYVAPISDEHIVADYISPLPDGEVLGTNNVQSETILAEKTMDLNNRYPIKSVNDVFGYNIRLAMYYLGEIPAFVESDSTSAGKGEFGKLGSLGEFAIPENFEVRLVLNPGEVFAFHDNVLPEFKDKTIKTIGSKFISAEGYKSSGALVGDGVCHLASLINWAATDAGLSVLAKVDHDFRAIPGIPKEFGTSIKYAEQGGNSQNQNLYITNNQDFPVEFRFEVNKDNVKIQILKEEEIKGILIIQ
jgi:hypothetical protein